MWIPSYSLFVRPYITVLAVASIMLSQIPFAQGSISLRGENRTCRDYADLDYALDHPSSAYFRGWTSNDFEAADTWVISCFASPPSPQDIERKEKLAERCKMMDAEVKQNDERLQKLHEADLEAQKENERRERILEAAQREAEATQLANHEARRADEARRLASQKAAQQALELCRRSPAYQRYLAATQIFLALERESVARRALEHEDRVEGVSGITDLSKKRIAGEALVGAEDDLNRWWSIYQRYDAGAKDPESIPRSMTDPCT